MEQRGIFLSSNNQYLPANTVSRRQCTEDTEEHQQMFSSIIIIRFCIYKMAWPGSDQAGLEEGENVSGQVEEIED